MTVLGGLVKGCPAAGWEGVRIPARNPACALPPLCGEERAPRAAQAPRTPRLTLSRRPCRCAAALQEEAADARRERNRKAALESYYK